jgi:hypothetical protein
MRLERIAQRRMLARFNGWLNKHEGFAELVYCVLRVCVCCLLFIYFSYLGDSVA